MTLTQIEYFVEVATAMNYSKVAENLYVSRQTLGKQIQALEKELNLELFDRNNKRNLQLTESGEILFHTWKELIKQTEEAIWIARTKSTDTDTIVRVGIHEMPILTDYSIALMKKFRKQFPHIIFVNCSEGMEVLEEKLQRKSLDLLIVLSTELDGLKKVNYLVSKQINSVPCIVMGKEHPLASKKKVQMQDLNEQTFLAYSRKYSADAHKKLMNNIRRFDIRPNAIIHYDNTEDLEMALALGEGVTFAFEFSFRNSDQLRYYPVKDDSLKTVDIVICWNQNQFETIAKQLAGFGK